MLFLTTQVQHFYPVILLSCHVTIDNLIIFSMNQNKLRFTFYFSKNYPKKLSKLIKNLKDLETKVLTSGNNYTWNHGKYPRLELGKYDFFYFHLGIRSFVKCWVGWLARFDDSRLIEFWKMKNGKRKKLVIL